MTRANGRLGRAPAGSRGATGRAPLHAVVPRTVAALLAALLVTACASPAPTPAPTSVPTPTASVASPASAPPGTAYIEVPEAGVRLPVPDGWETVDATALTDPSVRDRLAATYPGADRLLAAVDALGGRADPAFLAADPSAASLEASIATSLSVMVSQPSVGGLLLDLVAGFIRDGLDEALGADDDPERSSEQLPLGEAVRFDYAVMQPDGTEIAAVAWVIGAPAGTLLVTAIGTQMALEALDAGAIVAAIVPAEARP